MQAVFTAFAGQPGTKRGLLSAVVAGFSWITPISGHPEDARIEKVKHVLKVLSPDTHKRKTTLL